MVGRPNGRESSRRLGLSRGHLNSTAHILIPVTLRVFRLPYPLSTRCEVPSEDPANRGYCRPLPVDLFPITVLDAMPGRSGQSTLLLRQVLILFTTSLLYP